MTRICIVFTLAFTTSIFAQGTPPTPAELKKRYSERTTALHEAAEKGQVSLLLELLKSGADVNDKDEQARTALHKAAEKGNRSAAITLLMFGADVGEKDSKGQNPIHLAASAGNAEVLSLLISPSQLSQVAGDLIKGGAADALKTAGFNLKGATDKLSALLDGSKSAPDAQGQTPLMRAAAGGHADCVKAIGLYYDKGQRDKQGRTSLMIAVAGGHTELIRALWADGISVEYLLATDTAGKSASNLAKAASHTATVELLAEIEKKAIAEQTRAKLLSMAYDNDVAGLKAAFESTPPNVSIATDLVISASKAGSTQAVHMIMEMWKDKPLEEKVRLVGFPLTYNMRPHSAFHITAKAGFLETLKTLTDAEWWKDKATLADVLKRKDSGTDVYKTPLELAANNTISSFLEKKFKELEGKK